VASAASAPPRRHPPRRGNEIDAHLALLTADFAAQACRADARAHAEREFGRWVIRDECIAIARRRRRRVNLSETVMGILQDVRYTARSLRANAAFAVAAIVCTALGVGATATIFSAVHATLIRPLPFEKPDELVAVYAGIPAKNVTGVNISYPDYKLARRGQELALGIWTWNSPSFTERVSVARSVSMVRR
jgi:hypothetical protein